MSPKQVAVIGGGVGGYVSAIRAAQLGANVTLIEKDRIGGTCLNRGCIPTKSLLFDTLQLRHVRQSSVFQSLLREDFDPFGKMMKRQQALIHNMVDGVAQLLRSYGIVLEYGWGEIADRRKVTVFEGEKERGDVEVDDIILALGSRPKTTPDLGPNGNTVLTSDEVLQLNKRPDNIIIVGGGYIGIEFAAIFSALGSKVTIIEMMDRILPEIDDELVRTLTRSLLNDGITIHTRARVENVSAKEESVDVTIQTGDGIKILSGDKLLLAIGREPNLDFDFTRLGIEISSKGILVNEKMRTNVPGIYAVGDVTGGWMLAHVAAEEGIVAAESIMGLERRRDDGPIPLCIFSHPEIASIGMTEKQARKETEVQVGRFPFRSNPSAMISGESEGMIKVVAAREDRKILGVHMIGYQASTLIAIAASLVNHQVTTTEFSKMVQVHPSTPEAFKEACMDIDRAAIHLPHKKSVFGHSPERSAQES